MTSLIFGEIIIDCVQPDKSLLLFEPINGGSPYNLALALTRLGEQVALCSSVSLDKFGTRVIDVCKKEGIDIELMQSVDKPSTLAMVHSDPDGKVSYNFYLNNTSIEYFSWDKIVIAEHHDHLHPGSYVALHENLADDCLTFFRQHRHSHFISFDPNIRLDLTSNSESLRPLVEAYAELCDLIKASDEDLNILYPDLSVEEAARHLISKGTKLLIVTLGAGGSLAIQDNGTFVNIEANIPQTIGDTVGAGDSFMAGCFWQMRKLGLISRNSLALLSRDDLFAILSGASEVAGYNCQFFGCNPPRLVDL